VIGQPYLCEVSALYDDGESEKVEANWLPAIHNPPTNVSYELFPDHIQLSWAPPEGSNIDILEYRIYLDGSIYFTTTDLTCGIYDLTSGETYQVEVIAFYVDSVLSDPVVLNITFVEGDDILNLETNLIGNYPNPFNPTTTISFTINPTDAENVHLAIYDIKGQKVKTFTFPNRGLGTREESVIWNGTDNNGKPVSSGLYFYRLNAGFISDRSFYFIDSAK
jgi:hypothetical protein